MIFSYIQIIEREMDLVGFDAQLGRPIDPEKDRGAILGVNDDVRKKMLVIGKSKTGCASMLAVCAIVVGGTASVFLI